MNKLILSVGADKKYINNPHLKKYLHSISINSNFDINILIYLDENKIELDYDNIKVLNVDPLTIKKPNVNNCIQHGEFLNSDFFEEILDSDIIVFTDGDMTLQRPLSDDEINLMRNLKDNDVFIGYNKSPEDTLHDEYYRLSPSISDYSILFKDDLKNIKVYNTGVLCMNKKTWNKLKNEYITHFDEVSNIFNSYAKQQWLICLLLKRYNYNIIEMPYHIHNHTHYQSPLGTTNENGLIKFNNNVVLFKHRWF